MTANGKEQFRLGFLTAIETPGGFVGGLLVTNHQGRPLEFQCTAPVKPNRSQEILYGPTLRPFVLGDLIGQTLLDKAGVKPHLVLTEEALLLELREQVSIPVACLSEPAAEDSSGPSTPAVLGRQRLRFHAAHDGDREVVDRHAKLVPRDADLQEPFERVREALRETMRVPGA
jgi:hypothetical protein